MIVIALALSSCMLYLHAWSYLKFETSRSLFLLIYSYTEISNVSQIPIWISKLMCNVSQSLTVFNCPHSSSSGCVHSQDVALRCSSRYTTSEFIIDTVHWAFAILDESNNMLCRCTPSVVEQVPLQIKLTHLESVDYKSRTKINGADIQKKCLSKCTSISLTTDHHLPVILYQNRNM